MKPLSGRGSRQWVVGLTVAAALAVVGLLLGLTQTARAAATSLDGSEKLASSDTVSPGDEFTYMVVLRNDGASAVGPITVTDAFPAGVSYGSGAIYTVPSGKALWDTDSGNVRFYVPSVGTGSNSVITLTFVVDLDAAVPAETVINNTALISDGVETLSRSVAITVAAAPTVKIVSPWQNQTIDEQGDFVIEGRAWTADQDPEFPDAPVLDPIVYAAGNDWYFVEWSSVAGALTYILEEANSPDFANALAYPATTSLFQSVEDREFGKTYYYRVKARNAYEDSFWSNVVSVTVTSGLGAASVQDLAPAATATYQPVVQINVKKVGAADTWLPADAVVASSVGDWWDWSYTWDVQPEDDESVQYVIAVRGCDLGGNCDASLGDVVTVTVSNKMHYVYMPIIMKRWPPIPYPPTLSVTSNDNRGNYTLSWVAGAGGITAPTSYWIQEARDAAFTSLVTDQALPVSPTSYAFTNRGGTLYYRVAGVNSYGRGEWSNVVTVTSGYYEDFSNNTSGWPRTVYQWYSRNAFDVAYENGSYRAKILLNKDGLLNKIMGSVAAPWVNPYSAYDVEVSHYFARAGDQVVDPYGGKGGLIFGANSDFTTIYVVEWNFEGSCSVNKYAGRSAPISRSDIPRTIYREWGRCNSVKVGYNQTNIAKVTVIGNSATVYINGTEVASFTDSQLGSMHRVGILSGSWERTPVEGRFDEFRVTAR